MPDTFAQRSGEDYADAFARLLPRGRAWSRSPSSLTMKVVAGLAKIWGDVDTRAAALLTIESDPRQTTEMLEDWERNFGLPDPCSVESQTTGQRRVSLVNKMTNEGGVSRQYFIDLAASLGYTITIVEYMPYQTGMSQCGDTRPGAGKIVVQARAGAAQAGINHLADITYFATGGEYIWQVAQPEIRYFWKVNLPTDSFTWNRVGNGGGQVGVTHMVTFPLATDIECEIRRYKPAHTQVIFDYITPNTPDVVLDFNFILDESLIG